MVRTVMLTILCTMGAAMAAEMRIGDAIVTRKDTLRAVVRLDEPLTGPGKLTLTWADSYGRTVAVETRRVAPGRKELPVRLPLDRAVALQNFLSAEVTAGGRTVRARKKEFIVTPESPVWDDYQIIMYYAYRQPGQQDALRDVGITAGKLSSGGTQRRTGGKVWYSHDYRFYCDQISTFFYAAYHTPRYKPKQLMLLRAKEAYIKDRSSKKPFYRQPCFHDPKALAQAVRRLRTAAESQKHLRPFFYAHTDEGGVADLVAAWDFCFDPRTLAAFRKWLMAEYGSLKAINAQWDTDFERLDDVVPFSTDEMMARRGDNFSPWADHRTFMNLAFAEVLAAGTKAVEAVDPDARVGLVGCQMPAAFGGYDYWLLSRVMTAIEPYNIGNNREIWRSFAPQKPAVTTAFGFGDMEVWRLWYQMLHGDQGIIIYDEKNRYLQKGKTTPSELGAAIAPTYKELTGGLCKQLRNMARVEDPIAIHYSHPSITAHWMYEVRPQGQRWVRRSSGTERKTSPFLRLRETCTKLIEDNHLQYDFVAYAQLENGEFDKMGAKVLILPQSIAMSKAE
ncbi:MAG: beta-galactosidase, partial [Planctomycetota bacterium]